MAQGARRLLDDPQSETFTLYKFPSRQSCSEYALVLRAVGIDCEIRRLEGAFALVVAAEDASRAHKQLKRYIDENQPAPLRSNPRGKVSDGLISAFLFGSTIICVHFLQRHRAFSLDWWEAGKSHAGLIQNGEWWRTLTALGLHMDPLHLVGNVIFGALFCFLAGRLLGWGLACFAIVLTGALGNALNAIVQSPNHTSIGASTSVFAALGIVAFYTWKRRPRVVNRWVPLGGGLALLAFLGMKGGRTDIVAHVAGFALGGLFGAIFGFLEARLESLARHQAGLGMAALTLFAVAWLLALSALRIEI